MVTIHLDDYDKKILSLVEKDGRLRLNKIAERVGLSSPATHNRIVKLESYGFIKGYVALLDHYKMGFEVSAVISITFETHDKDSQQAVLAKLNQLEQVIEILHITGEHDLLLRVLAHNVSHLNQLVNEELVSIDGIGRIATSTILNVHKPMYKGVKKAPALSADTVSF